MYSLTSRATWTRDGRKKLRSSRKWFDGWLLLDGGRLRLYDEERRLVADEPCIERPHHVRSKWSEGEEMAPFRGPEFLVVPDPPVEREEFFVAPEGPAPLLPGVRRLPSPVSQRLPSPERAAARPVRRPFRPPGPLLSLDSNRERLGCPIDPTGAPGYVENGGGEPSTRRGDLASRGDLEEWDCEGQHAEAPIDPIDESAPLVESKVHRGRPSPAKTLVSSQSAPRAGFGLLPARGTDERNRQSRVTGDQMVDLLSTESGMSPRGDFQEGDDAPEAANATDEHVSQRFGEGVHKGPGDGLLADDLKFSPRGYGTLENVQTPSWEWAAGEQTKVPPQPVGASSLQQPGPRISGQQSPREETPSGLGPESSKRVRCDDPVPSSEDEDALVARRPFGAFACELRWEDKREEMEERVRGDERGSRDLGALEANAEAEKSSLPLADAGGERHGKAAEGAVFDAAIARPNAPNSLNGTGREMASASGGRADGANASGDLSDDAGTDEDWDCEEPVSLRQETAAPAGRPAQGANGSNATSSCTASGAAAAGSSDRDSCQIEPPGVGAECCASGADVANAERSANAAALPSQQSSPTPRVPPRRKGLVLRTVDGAGLGPGSLASARLAAKSRGDPFEMLRFPGPEGQHSARRLVAIADEFDGGVAEWIASLEDSIAEEANLRCEPENLSRDGRHGKHERAAV